MRAPAPALRLPLHVETTGREPGPDTPTFLLLHGFGASSFSWRTWAAALAARGHVVFVDLKGFGSAPRPDDGAYGIEDQAELVLRLIRQRGLRRVTLVGHSMGGGVALLVALGLLDSDPGCLDRMVIVAGAAYRQRLPPFVALARWPRLSGAGLRVLGTRRVIRWVLRSIVAEPDAVTGSQVEGYADPLDSAEARRALFEVARGLVPDDLDAITARYPEIAVPTLVLWGRDDRVVPLRIGQRLAEALPRAELEVLDDCGHIPAEERPEESLEILTAFLERTTGA
ncbi:MAG: alpha/beta hydrolase [Longimicrobiales bacterium]